jgi:hypothetical protein
MPSQQSKIPRCRRQFHCGSHLPFPLAFVNLAALYRQLRITTGVFNYKKTHVSGTGQKSNTRARTLLSQLTAKTKLFADRYQAARKALVSLDPNGDW